MILRRTVEVSVWEVVISGVTGYDKVVTGAGLESMVSCLAAPFNYDNAWMPFIAIGDGEVAVGSEDEQLSNELWRKKGTVTKEGDDERYTVLATFGEGEPSGACVIREVGIFDRIAGGVMAARWVLDEDVAKSATQEVEIRCMATAI